MKVKDCVLHTNGKGLWSDVKAEVKIDRISLGYVNEDRTFGSLNVYFKNWNIQNRGLIYTDPLFLKELKAYFKSIGVSYKGIGYSEQGLQGDDHVNLDVGAAFIKSWKTKKEK